MVEFNNEGITFFNYKVSMVELWNCGFKIIRIFLIILGMYLVIKIGSALINKFVEKQKKLKYSLDIKKAKTIGEVLKSILKYSVYFIGVLGIITEIFGNFSLTFAGIGGVAIGFAAQNIIKDVINGFFILFEDQFSVGDYINVDDKGGIVESIELRITRIRDLNGDLHIIPNGQIIKVTNHSRGSAQVMVDIDVSYEENLDKVIQVLNKVCEDYKLKNTEILDGPKVLGIGALKENSISFKIIGKTRPLKNGDCAMEIRKDIKKAFDEANIKNPYPRRIMMKEKSKDGQSV